MTFKPANNEIMSIKFFGLVTKFIFEYIKGQQLYRILLTSAHILLSFFIRIGAFDHFRVFVLMQIFRVLCTLFIGVCVQRANVDHCD